MTFRVCWNLQHKNGIRRRGNLKPETNNERIILKKVISDSHDAFFSSIYCIFFWFMYSGRLSLLILKWCVFDKTIKFFEYKFDVWIIYDFSWISIAMKYGFIYSKKSYEYYDLARTVARKFKFISFTVFSLCYMLCIVNLTQKTNQIHKNQTSKIKQKRKFQN